MKKFAPHNRALLGLHKGFSLIEMLMALLVASLLMAALAPVMIKKTKENVKLSGEVNAPKLKKHEINYGSENECRNMITDPDGSEYCEGVFVVPQGYNGQMKITLVGAGGGGGAAATAGYVEYTTASDAYTFKVPAMVGKVSSTLISGGAGGAPGGQVLTNVDWTTGGGTSTWTVPVIARSKNVLVTGCGGGGGGGGSWAGSAAGAANGGGGGGSGAYRVNILASLGAQTTADIFIGGGGGFGGGDDSGTCGNGRGYGGGGGGHEAGTAAGCTGSGPGGAGGRSGSNSPAGAVIAFGGTGATNGMIVSPWTGGAGSTGGGGGAGGAGDAWLVTIQGGGGTSAGGGGGGPEGGGGGGGTSAGSGAGGGGATLIKQSDATLFSAGGGGGAAGQGFAPATSANHRDWGGGGGGGGFGAGAGGTAFTFGGIGGTGGVSGTTNVGGRLSTNVWGNLNLCAGGNGGISTSIDGLNGNDGALRISYLNFGTGGSGGGSGRAHADYSIKVTQNEDLGVSVGSGMQGGTPGVITGAGAVQAPTEPACTTSASNIRRGATVLAGDSVGLSCGGGLNPGRSSGIACGPHVSPYASEGGWVYWSGGTSYPVNGGMSIAPPTGYSATNGRPAGDGANLNCDAASIATGTSGGRGATITTPYTGTCTPGVAGTSGSTAGGNASGYGCGGGGGYGLARGGNGSSGYVRIYWNKVWDSARSVYNLLTGSSGGGGASGNILTYSLTVKSGDIIKIRIGKGGAGAKVVNNVIVTAKNGGNTEFATLKSGGGLGGLSPSVNASNDIVNGAAGSFSAICSAGGTSYLNDNNFCTKGSIGTAGGASQGGNGATLDKYGAGGDGGVQDTGANSNGNSATGIGAGGGGAAIRDLGKVNNPSDSVNNPISGGSGANGKIIIEWYE